MRRLLIPHLALWVLGAATLRLVAAPAEACPPVTAEQVRTAIDRTSDWLAGGIGADGRFLYGYTLDRDEVNTDYSVVRHVGTMYSLYQVAAEVDPTRLGAADASLAYVLGNLFRHDDWAAFAPPGVDPQTGANALAIAGFVNRRRATGDERYDDLLRELGRFLIAQQQPNGAVLKFWDRQDQAPVQGSFGKFAPGESFWAMALLDTTFPGEGWDESARALGDYLALERDLAEGFLPRQPDHWASYALGELSNDALTEIEIEYARRLSGYFGTMAMYESQRTGSRLSELFRGEAASGAGAGVMGEALGSLWRASRAEPRLAGLSDQLAHRIECHAGLLVDRQFKEDQARVYPDPAKVNGAWFRGGYTQVDDQQHSLSALILALPVLEQAG